MPSTPLRDPHAFFSERTPSLFSAALILYITGITAVSSGIPTYSQGGSIELTPGLALLAVLVGGAIGAAGIWTAFTIVIYLATAVAGGSGSLKQTAANIGWSLLPFLFMNIVSTGTTWFLYLIGELPTVMPTSVRSPLWLAVFYGVINIMGHLWLGYIFVYAIHDAQGIPLRRAAGIAVLISFISMLYSVSFLL